MQKEQKENEFRYIAAPIPILRGLTSNYKQNFQDIIRIGLYNVIRSSINNATQEEIVNSAIYCYLRKKHLFDSTELYYVLEDNEEGEDCYLHEDYVFDSEGNFEPDSELTEHVNKIISEHELWASGEDLYLESQLVNVTKNFNLIPEPDFISYTMKQITDKNYDKMLQDNNPFFMLNLDLFFKFSKMTYNHEVCPGHEFSIMQLLFYLAIDSIIGKKNFAKTNRKMILARAFGYSRPGDVSEKCNLYLKYQKRYHFDKTMQELELNWNIITYSNHMRGLYVANKSRINLQELVLHAEQNKRKNRIKQLKNDKQKARQKALNDSILYEPKKLYHGNFEN